MNIWREYFGYLNVNETSINKELELFQNVLPLIQDHTREEVDAAVKQLKSNKTSEEDGIAADLIRAG